LYHTLPQADSRLSLSAKGASTWNILKPSWRSEVTGFHEGKIEEPILVDSNIRAEPAHDLPLARFHQGFF
jgi:hypothetical protein